MRIQDAIQPETRAHVARALHQLAKQLSVEAIAMAKLALRFTFDEDLGRVIATLERASTDTGRHSDKALKKLCDDFYRLNGLEARRAKERAERDQRRRESEERWRLRDEGYTRFRHPSVNCDNVIQFPPDGGDAA